MIDVTGIDLKELTKKAYELSQPQGLGLLHFTPEPLSDEEAKKLVSICKEGKHCALSLDYVNGRACKLIVFRREGKLVVADAWYDHTDRQYHILLDHFGIKKPDKKEHGISCNCMDCASKRAGIK